MYIHHKIKIHKQNNLKDLKFFYQLTPDKYYELLSKKFKSIKMWETPYYHLVPSFDSVIEWYKGSGLKPYLDLLSDSKKEVFLEELKENYKVYNDNSIILKMPRLFFIALK